jgi:lipoprotein-releasing system permease protein
MRSRFELSIALKYLIPRRKQISVSLIALLSVAVISLVVWLVLVFLSVTEGIERNWLQKLTVLNAPLRITPTQYYLSSYYYQVDEVSSRSQYTLKTIAEKAQSSTTDPYLPSEDDQLPPHLPQPDLASDGSLKDPVKGLFALLDKLKENQPTLAYQDFEISGALMRLQLLRRGNHRESEESQGYLTQVCYLASLPDQSPGFSSLLILPTVKDLNHLLYLANHSTDLCRQDTPALALKADKNTACARILKLLENVKIRQLKSRYPFWQIPSALLPEKQVFKGQAHFRNGSLSRIDIPTEKTSTSSAPANIQIWKEGSELVLEDSSGHKERVSIHTPILVAGTLQLHVEDPLVTDNLRFKIATQLQGVALKGQIDLEGLEIAEADFFSKSGPTAPWFLPYPARDIDPVQHKAVLPINEEKETGVLLAKSFSDSGVMIGDRGYLCYSSTTSSSLQEHRMPIFVSGFYDPGILSIGNKPILVPPFVTQAINSSSSSFNLDKMQSNGTLVWFHDLSTTEQIKNQILCALSEKGLEKYWKVTTFREYDFARDLLEQFQSDKYLFAIIGIIILFVACCNIISMLVLLVNDKKREIGILQAMGASRLSIASIFGICGIAMGILSSIIGAAAALVTLQHIDTIVQLLSYFQGHDAFNSAFFGKSLPSQLSHNAVTFILFTTPIISLLAGLVPAIKACRLRPSETLRAE